MKQLLSLSTAILMSTSLMAGAAFAQETGAVPMEPSDSASDWMSDEERALFEGPDSVFGTFFTDETFTTLQDEDEFESSMGDLAEEDQAALRQACADIAANPAAYTENTQNICIRAGLM